jgi:hypothetical protein
VPKGEFLSGAIRLRSNTNLHLARGGTIRFTHGPSKYPLVFTRWEGVELMNFSPFIYAFAEENIAVTGRYHRRQRRFGALVAMERLQRACLGPRRPEPGEGRQTAVRVGGTACSRPTENFRARPLSAATVHSALPLQECTDRRNHAAAVSYVAGASGAVDECDGAGPHDQQLGTEHGRVRP